MAPFSWVLSAAAPETRTVLANTDVRETTEEGGRVLVDVERLVISEGVVPLRAPAGGLRPVMTVADHSDTSRTPV